MIDSRMNPPQTSQAGAVPPVLDTYRTWVDTLAGCMKRAAALLERLYAEQDPLIDQLRRLCARIRGLRHADFDAIFAKVLVDRTRTRQSLSALVEGYRTARESAIREAGELLESDAAQAVRAWPAVKQRLLGESDDGTGQIVAALREVHVKQEKVSAALSGLLMRGDRLKIDDLRTVAQRLASRDSRDTAELAALLAACESAGRDAETKWRRLAG